MARQAGAEAGPRHGVPLIAVTPGVERERPGRKRWRGLGLFDRDQARLGVGCRETAIGERRPAPAIWLHHVIGRVRNRAMMSDIEYAPAIILIGRKTGMLAVDLGGPGSEGPTSDTPT